MSVNQAKPDLYEDLASRIRQRTVRTCIVGLGYVGLPLAQTFVRGGYSVVGYDIDRAKIVALNERRSYIAQIPARDIEALFADGRFRPTDDPTAFKEANAIVICVPTPLTETREPDLSFIVETTKSIKPHLRKGQLVVLESTTYPGTTEDVVRPILESTGLRAEKDFFLAFSPEREDPGNRDFSTRTTPKVVGGVGPLSSTLASALYQGAVERVVTVSDSRVAEAAKILENTYRAVNIALVNELKVLFHRMGINVWEVIDAAKTKPFGFQAFYPGPGLGGHCIPIDPFYLTWVAHKYGMDTQFIELAGRVNTAMPRYVVDRISEALNDRSKPMKGSRILVLGLAYKRDIDDTRESPSFPVIELLLQRGARVSWHDPFHTKMPHKREYDLATDRMELTEENLRKQDAVVVVTDHSSYDYAWIAKHAPLLVDSRGATRHLGSLPNVVSA
jgi:UDP-N-acetyl-D-glucosamine dehydrogenase